MSKMNKKNYFDTFCTVPATGLWNCVALLNPNWVKFVFYEVGSSNISSTHYQFVQI